MINSPPDTGAGTVRQVGLWEMNIVRLYLDDCSMDDRLSGQSELFVSDTPARLGQCVKPLREGTIKKYVLVSRIKRGSRVLQAHVLLDLLGHNHIALHSGAIHRPGQIRTVVYEGLEPLFTEDKERSDLC